MTTSSSRNAIRNAGRLQMRSAETTAVISRPQNKGFLPADAVITAVDTEQRLAALAQVMTSDQLDPSERTGPAGEDRAGAEPTLVDSQVAERIAAELAIAHRAGPQKPPRPCAPAPAVRLGKYRLLRHLASGRTSHVYLACLDGPAGFARHLAIKTLRARFAQDPARVAAFAEVARLFSRFHHGSIAQISDVGVDSGTHYVVMDHLHGVTLRAALEHYPGGVPLDFAISAIASCAEALHYARSKQADHDARHLGIAPSYVMACADGAIKVFRLGYTGSPAPMLTSQELAYLAPEQARGEISDARSEVFALGVMLYQLTTGAHPTLDPSSEPTCRSARDRLLHGEIEPPVRRSSHVPSELSEVVMTALARDPDLRYPDGRVFAQALLEVAQRLGRRPGPLAVRQLVNHLLGERPADDADPTTAVRAMTARLAPPTDALASTGGPPGNRRSMAASPPSPLSSELQAQPPTSDEPTVHSPAWLDPTSSGSVPPSQHLRARHRSPADPGLAPASAQRRAPPRGLLRADPDPGLQTPASPPQVAPYHRGPGAARRCGDADGRPARGRAAVRAAGGLRAAGRAERLRPAGGQVAAPADPEASQPERSPPPHTAPASEIHTIDSYLICILTHHLMGATRSTSSARRCHR